MDDVGEQRCHLQNVVVAHPGPGLALPLLAGLGPDLVKARHDEGSPEIEAQSAIIEELVLGSPLHLEDEVELAAQD